MSPLDDAAHNMCSTSKKNNFSAARNTLKNSPWLMFAWNLPLSQGKRNSLHWR